MNDLEFVQKCVKGDKETWDAFLDRYSRLIYSYIHSILKLKGANQSLQDKVNDLFQEVFYLLTKDNFKKLKSFKAKNGCSLATWLRTVVINFTLDYIRKSKPSTSLDAQTPDGEFNLKEILPDNSPSVIERLEERERITSLKDCIKELDTDDKYFLELYLNRGLTLEELKDIFKISRAAVDMRKSKIVYRLKECFKRKGFTLDF